MRATLIWTALGLAMAVPIVLAAQSPLLAWRQPVYIAAGLAGIAGMTLLLLQPLLALGVLPGLDGLRGRRVHRMFGVLLVLSIALHIVGLWITSPPDVIDALLFRSPTPFSHWGMIALIALFATATLAALRRRLRVRPKIWRRAHGALALVIVGGTILHAALIDGTMETLSKLGLSLLVGLATLMAASHLFGIRR